MDVLRILDTPLRAVFLSVALVASPLLLAQLAPGERHVLAAPTGSSAEYGTSVAFDGAVAVVGDPSADAVHVFTRSASTAQLSFTSTLRPQDQRDGRFGTALALSGNVLFVGAPDAIRDADGGEDARGQVFVYRNTGGTWAFDRVLRGAQSDPGIGDRFGAQLAASGRHLLVAANEERAVYAFDVASGASALQKIDVNARAPSPHFWDEISGLKSLLVDGDSAVLGLQLDDYTAFHALRWNGVRWEWEAEILDESLPPFPFGGGASLRGGQLLIPTRLGVRHFERTGAGQWIERAIVGASATFDSGEDRRRVALGETGAVVLEAAALRFYARDAGTWRAAAGLVAAPPVGSAERARFARALAASGNAVLVGSPGNRDPAMLLGPPAAASTTSLEILGPLFAAGEHTVGSPVALVFRLRSTEPVQGMSVNVFEGSDLRCTANLQSDGTGRCNAVFPRAGRITVEARFDGAAGLAAASARHDVLVQPVLRAPTFERRLQMQVGVPFRGQFTVDAIDAAPPFRFMPLTLVDGVTIDANGLISGTPTAGAMSRVARLSVLDSSASRHGLDFRWSHDLDIQVLPGGTTPPMISIAAPPLATLEVGVQRAPPVTLLGPSDGRLLVRSLTPDVCRVDAPMPLAITGLRMGVCRLSYEASGTGYAATSGQWDVAVSTRGRPLMFARPDRVVLARAPSNALPAGESPSAAIDVIGNDLFNPRDVDLATGLTIVRQPLTGSVQVGASGVLQFVPRQTYTAIRDSFRYRLCSRSSGSCSEADVRVVAQPGIPPGTTLNVEGQRGSRVLDFRAITTGGPIERHTGALMAPTRLAWSVPPSPGIDSPFDEDLAGAMFAIRPIPANSTAAAVSWRVHAEASGGAADSLAVYLGLDANQNGRPDENEVVCASTGGSSTSTCDTHFARAAGQGVQAYWVLLHNRGTAGVEARVDLYQGDAVVAQAPQVIVTGPATSPSLVPSWPTRVTWDDPTLQIGDKRLVDVSFWRGASFLGEAPVHLVRVPGRPSPTALRDGIDHPFSLAPGEQHRRLYFDVPRAAAEVRIDLGNAPGVSLTVVRAPIQSEHDPSDAPAGPVVASLPAADANKTITLSTSRLAPGRWYLVPVNEGASTAVARLRVTTSAGGTRVDPVPGHYYNQARSGHGAFLDYAGNQWVLIWYTYREDGSSVWYMTDVADRSSTSWTAPLLQFGWDRGRRVSTPVGWVSVNAVSPSAFEFSYTLHGRSGHERFERLGGPGCVSTTLGGPPFDVSGLWFAPELPGYGWSVQIDAASRQAIVASYLYDDLGQPAWVWSQDGLGNLGAFIELSTARLQGACPWCTYRPTTAVPDTGYVSLSVDDTRIRFMRLQHFDRKPATPNFIDWSWNDPAMRAVSQLSQPSGCR